MAAGVAASTVSDRELVARLMAGDPAALADAYREYAGLVFGVCKRVLGDRTAAEDVTQDVFLFLWRSPERFDPARGTLRSWLGTLSHHRSVDRVRAEGSRVVREQRQDVPVATSDFDGHLEEIWLCDRVRVALTALPAEQRDAIVLAYFGGRTYRQVADELSIPEGTAKSRLRLALAKLDTLLRSDYIDQDAPAWT